MSRSAHIQGRGDSRATRSSFGVKGNPQFCSELFEPDAEHAEPASASADGGSQDVRWELHSLANEHERLVPRPAGHVATSSMVKDDHVACRNGL